jgi:hypothetical protein
MGESEFAMRAVREGLTTIVPATILPLLTWREMQLSVCGSEGVDVDLLEANTEYDTGLSRETTHIQFFWNVLRAFEMADQRAFLRFAWARSRLPLESASFRQKFKIQADPNSKDGSLPTSHTCFFQLALPAYSSEAVMRKQLLYAVRNCIAMDGDFRLSDTEMTGWDNLQL